MGFTEDGAIADENSPVSLEDMVGHYKRSKFMAEQAALEAGRNGANVVVVNPTTPIGESDIKPTPTGRIIVDFLNKKFPGYVDTGLNLAEVKEVARGHLLAMEKAVPGERYILGGENLTLKQILDKLAALTGLPSPTMKVPHAVAMGFAVFDQFFTGTLRGKEPRATVDAVRMGRKKMFASSSKAERELGYRIVPVEDALVRAIEWFRARGYAPQAEQMARATA
jgi:dihydroflavonol-4-reductase